VDNKLKVEIVGLPGGIPGDVAMTLKWGLTIPRISEARHVDGAIKRQT
jgi:hypothetical protein